MRLEGKVALISGGARGMGAVEARLFVSEGAKVGIADIREEEGRALEAEIKESGGDAMFVSLDVTDEQQWSDAVDAVMTAYGRLDILVNNAGIFARATVEETSAADWDLMLDINGKGVFLGTKAVRGWTAYNASKGAVRLLTKSTAVQHAAENIRVNSVHPGPIETDMLDLVYPEDGMREERAENIPIPRMGASEDVAYGVLFLASDAASYMTGSELVIDGGVTAT
ncbi:Cyclopentanol dehydrogenase [Geodia barretti]|uniref:3-ketoacyl-[acyl-carrier-protein] reductase beta subunit n=1 Tax=Geodia barretti TaxID=519541 RepID=A0AA35RCC4_GEOBA|nr:Cyclopentanol dehydrogenase [Geodia barretti]